MANEEADVMKDLAAEWKPEMANAGTSGVPAGNATLKVTNAFIERSKNGRKQLTLQVEVLDHKQDPTANGSKLPMRFGLDFATKIDDLKRLNTALINLQLAPISGPLDVQRACRELSSVCFDGVVAKNNDPQFPPNVYVNGGARRKDLEGATSGSTTGTPTGGTARF